MSVLLRLQSYLSADNLLYSLSFCHLLFSERKVKGKTYTVTLTKWHVSASFYNVK